MRIIVLLCQALSASGSFDCKKNKNVWAQIYMNLEKWIIDWTFLFKKKLVALCSQNFSLELYKDENVYADPEKWIIK